MRPYVYPETIALIVEAYGRDAPRRALEAGWWRAEGQSRGEWLRRIGQASLFNKRHGHQRRLRQPALDAGTAALERLAIKIEATRNFHALWELIRKTFEPIRGLGELAVYDTAERLRHRLGLASAHLVYLHAGTRIGARALVGGRLDRHEGWSLLCDQLPEGLRNLSMHEIEDILCTYKHDLLLSPTAFQARQSSKPTKTSCDANGVSATC